MESTRIFPVGESSGFVIWTTTACKNQTQKNEGDNDDDLDGGQVEFELSEKLYTEIIDNDNYDEEYCDENTGIDLFAGNPILQDKRGGGQLIRGNNDVLWNVLSFWALCQVRKHEV